MNQLTINDGALNFNRIAEDFLNFSPFIVVSGNEEHGEQVTSKKVEYMGNPGHIFNKARHCPSQ